MKRARRVFLLLLPTLLVGLALIPLRLVLGVESVAPDAGTAASRMTWPVGVDLLAAAELELPAGAYEWVVTTLALTGDDVAFVPGNGVIVNARGSVLAQVNGRDTFSIARDAAAPLTAGDRWQVRSSSPDAAVVLVVEVLPAGTARTGDSVTVLGPLDVPGGNTTLVLVDLDKDRVSETAPEEVMQGALRPGVSIRHDESGIPATPEPNQAYDRWVIALFPHGGAPSVPVQEVGVATPASTPTSSAPVASPTVVATPTSTLTPTPTEPVPTATSTPTPTPTVPIPTATSTPTPTPTVPVPTATSTPTPTPTVPAPTATSTPTPTPTGIPPTATLEPTPTPTAVPLLELPPVNVPLPPLEAPPGSD